MNTQHASHQLEQALANDLRTNELGISVEFLADRVVLRGEVASRDRRDAVLTVVREKAPAIEVTDELVISGDAVHPPHQSETIPSANERTSDD